MQAFFNICEYLQLTPEQFFQTDTPDPAQLRVLVTQLRHLDVRQLELIGALVEELNRR